MHVGWSARKELEDIASYFAGNISEVVLREALEELLICLVGERVLAPCGRPAGIEVGVRDRNPPIRRVAKLASVAVASGSKTLHEQTFSPRRRRLEGEWPERTEARQHFHHDGDESRHHPGLAIHRAEGLLVFLPRQRVNERAALHGRRNLPDVVFLVPPCDDGHLRNSLADRPPEGPDCQVRAEEQILDGQAVGLAKRTLEQRLRYFESDERPVRV